MKYYALFYDVVENFTERRMPYREAHLKLVNGAKERGDLVMAGPLGDPPERALLVFRVADVSVVEDFVRADPYVHDGIVTGWQVKAWNVVVGAAQ